MRFKLPLIEQLSDATPRKSILKWLLITFIYATVIIVNDHFEVIQALGLPERLTAIVRLAGVYLYIMLTTHSFYKTQKNENDNNHNQISADLADNDQPDSIPPASGIESPAQRDREHEP